MSPRGEWLDFDIDHKRQAGLGLPLDSKFEVTARVDSSRRIWYGAMRIPRASIGLEVDADELEVSVNFFRSPGHQHLEIAWKPTFDKSFYVPQQFGILRMIP